MGILQIFRVPRWLAGFNQREKEREREKEGERGRGGKQSRKLDTVE